jgi:hypothetical protein
MDTASEALYALNAVSFHNNREYDATQTLAFGLIAEEVAEVYPDLVGRDPEGQPESVRYEQINAMLLNEFLKEHRKVQEQEAAITRLKKDFDVTIAQFTERLHEQAEQIQRVSAQVEMSKPAPQVVNNPESRLEWGCVSAIDSNGRTIWIADAPRRLKAFRCACE